MSFSIKKIFLMLPLIVSSSLSASYTAEEVSQVKIDNTITLPIDRLEAVESEGQIYFMSGNGRYVLRGELTDVWNKKVLTRFSDIKDSVSKIQMSNMGLNTEELNVISVGTGDKEVFSFVDPLCTYCHELMKDAKKIAGDTYTFHFIVIPAMGDKSNVLARKVLCMDDESAFDAMVNNKLKSVKEDKSCNKLEDYRKTLVLSTLIGVNGVPMTVAPNGEYKYGIIDSLSEWLGERQ